MASPLTFSGPIFRAAANKARFPVDLMVPRPDGTVIGLNELVKSYESDRTISISDYPELFKEITNLRPEISAYDLLWTIAYLRLANGSSMAELYDPLNRIYNSLTGKVFSSEIEIDQLYREWEDKLIANLPLAIDPNYDNSATELYKIAYNSFQNPVRLMVVVPKPGALDRDIRNAQVVPLSEFIEQMDDADYSPTTIMSQAINYGTGVSTRDVLMTYLDLWLTDSSLTDQQVFQKYRELLTNFNQMLPLNIEAMINDHDQWLAAYDDSVAQDFERIKEINQIRETLSQVQDSYLNGPLASRSVAVNTRLDHKSTILSFSPTLYGQPVNIDDGLYLTDKANLSRYAPYLRYVNPFGQPVNRIFQGAQIEDVPNYNYIRIDDNRNKPNHLYLTLWLGDPTETGAKKIRDATDSSFHLIIYDLTINKLSIESPEGEKSHVPINADLAINRAKRIFSMLVFGDKREDRINGEFELWNISFEECTFLDAVLNDPVMRGYLYVEEHTKPFAFKKRLDVHYRSVFTDENESAAQAGAYISNSASVRIVMTQQHLEEPRTVEFENPTGNILSPILSEDFPARTPYIRVNISQGQSIAVVREFMFIFRLLIRYYYQLIIPDLSRLNEPGSLYNRYMTVMRNDMIRLERFKRQKLKLSATSSSSGGSALAEDIRRTGRSNQNIKTLIQMSSTMFQNASRICPNGQRPLAVGEEVADYQETLYRDSQGKVGRQVMRLPTNTGAINFLCDNKDAPEFSHPGFKVRQKLDENATDEFPYIVCCFRDDHMSPGINSHYRDYIEGRPVRISKGAGGGNTITSNKLLATGKEGIVPQPIIELLSSYREPPIIGSGKPYGVLQDNSVGSDRVISISFKRIGVPHDYNSLIHCVETAFQNLDYLRNPVVYAAARRQALATRLIEPALMKQEMYDYDEETIRRMFADENSVLDPALFFRAIEEAYNINLYVFNPTDKSGKNSKLEIPRHIVYHGRPMRADRNTILIMKSMGSESNNAQFPQCDLIVDDTVPNNLVRIFDPRMEEVCHNLLTETYRTITWDPLQGSPIPAFVNLYSRINYQGIFGFYRPVSQMIDNYGKMVALTFELPSDSNGRASTFELPSSSTLNKFTIWTLPSTPINLPTTSTITRVAVERIGDIMADRPIAWARQRDIVAEVMVDGLWFELFDLKYGLFIPINLIPLNNLIYTNLPEGPSSPLPNDMNSQSLGLARGQIIRQRIANIIRELMFYFYELYRNQGFSDPYRFASQYLTVDSGFNGDSTTYYDIKFLQRKLPLANTVEQAIAELNRSFPDFCTPTQIVMYNQEMFNRILRLLVVQAKTVDGLPVRIATAIPNFYANDFDFTPIPHVLTFIGEEALKQWESSRLLTINSLGLIRTIIPPNELDKPNIRPYLYKMKVGSEFKIYQIQNVISDRRDQSIRRALEVAATYYNYQNNVGNNPYVNQGIDYSYVLYAIGRNNQLVPVEDHRITSGPTLEPGADYSAYLQIMFYGSVESNAQGHGGIFGAMLDYTSNAK